MAGLVSTHFPLPDRPRTQVPGALRRPSFGASGCPYALPGGTGAHVHLSRLTYRLPPRMQTRASKSVHGPHLHTLPSRTAFSPRSGPGTCVHAGRPAHRAPPTDTQRLAGDPEQGAARP